MHVLHYKRLPEVCLHVQHTRPLSACMCCPPDCLHTCTAHQASACLHMLYTRLLKGVCLHKQHQACLCLLTCVACQIVCIHVHRTRPLPACTCSAAHQTAERSLLAQATHRACLCLHTCVACRTVCIYVVMLTPTPATHVHHTRPLPACTCSAVHQTADRSLLAQQHTRSLAAYMRCSLDGYT